MGESQTTISRRALLRDAAIAGIAVATPALLDSPAALARALPRVPRSRHPALPSPRYLRRKVEEMVELGPRLPGTRPHREFVDALEHRFRRSGLAVERDRHRFSRWSAKEYSLELLDGPSAGAVPVASYYTYSGRTPAAGVEGGLTYIGPLPALSVSGDPTDLDTAQAALAEFIAELPGAIAALAASVPGGVGGRIAVMEAPVAPLFVGALYALLAYEHDPDGTLNPTDDYKRAWTTLLTLPVLAPFRALGAAGVVFVLDASAANAAGQYTPFIHDYQDVPALICSREAGPRLRAAAAAGARARLRLPAKLKDDVPSDSLLATLPGRKGASEAVIVHTHTDGQNAYEENAPIAQIALARYFARIPRSARKRDLVFSAVTGHFGPGLPETHGLIEDHADVIERASAALVLEHLGAREWRDDAAGYHPTGRIEPGAIFHSPGPMTAIGTAAIKAADLRRSLLLRPLNPVVPGLPAFFGVGSDLHAAGVPTLAYIAGPNYLLALDGTDGHLDKFSARRMRTEVRWAADVLRRLVL